MVLFAEEHGLSSTKDTAGGREPSLGLKEEARLLLSYDLNVGIVLRQDDGECEVLPRWRSGVRPRVESAPCVFGDAVSAVAPVWRLASEGWPWTEVVELTPAFERGDGVW